MSRPSQGKEKYTAESCNAEQDMDESANTMHNLC